jgi:ribosomal protein S18 acetylase RimI-like enzyme
VTVTVRTLDATEAARRIDALVEILCDAVDSGASVSFLPPMDPASARRFWEKTIAAVAAGDRMLCVAEDEAGPVGAVQLELVATPNQPHRREVAKLLVHRRARRQGVGRMLMLALEEEARRAGRKLITMDTRKGDKAEPLYVSLGYTIAGVIPRYALSGEGTLDDTAILYKEL